jgi:two-component system nitrogen regulation response regulator NtrX
MARILVIDDERSIRRGIIDILGSEGYQSDEAADGKEGLALLGKTAYDVVLCDIKMPRLDGIEFLEEAAKIKPDVPVIMISGHGSIETAVEAVKKGAYDYISKPPDLNRMLITIRNATEKSSLITDVKTLRRRTMKTDDMIGESKAIQEIKSMIGRIAPTDARVLITGPNGVGKELVARWLHMKGPRSSSPLVEVNCAAIPSELIESELFGHERGAFTSAHQQRIGKFEQANGGTLFLDEIGDMSLDAQATMLRALQEGRITRVGGDKNINVNARVISATNKNLLQEIDDKRFRLDLYHRLGVIIIKVPSLNERREDIPLLVRKFIKDITLDYGMPAKEIEPRAMQDLVEYDWTGNIRELHNVVERLIILAGKTITHEDVKAYVLPGA